MSDAAAAPHKTAPQAGTAAKMADGVATKLADGQRSLYVCGRYEGGMRDFHLSLMAEARAAGEEPVSVVRLTRKADLKELRAEHDRHGITRVHVLPTTAWWLRQAVKIVPIFALWAYWLRWRLGAKRMVITGEGFCFGSLPGFAARRAEIFYHDPDPHESADQGRKVQFENAYKARVHETKPWAALLIGAQEYQDRLAARAVAPVRLMAFPRFTRHLFPAGPTPAELAGVQDYILLYGRIDRYKGIYDWLVAQAPHMDRLPPIVIAGRVVDTRVHEFADRATLIDRFILNEEVAALFDGAQAVVLPYTSVTHSGIGDIALSFDKPTYLPALPYFTARYVDEPLMRPLETFISDFGLTETPDQTKSGTDTAPKINSGEKN